MNLEQIFLKIDSDSAIYLFTETINKKIKLPKNFINKFYPLIQNLFNSKYNEDKTLLSRINESGTFEDFLYYQEINFDKIEALNNIKKEIQQFNIIDKEQQLLTTYFYNLTFSIFEISINSSLKCSYFLQQYYNMANIHLRENEQRFCIIYQYHSKYKSFRNKEINSYRIYKLNQFQSIPNNIVFPTTFKLHSPNDITSPKLKKLVYNTYNLRTNSVLQKDKFIPNEYPNDLFYYSTLLQCNSVLELFNHLYNDYDTYYNCNFIKMELNVPSIFFKKGFNIKILLNCKMNDKNEIEFLEEDNNKFNNLLIESILLNEYGKYSMFCGHFVLIIKSDEFLCSRRYIYANNPNSYYIQTSNSGSFILEFFTNEIILQKTNFINENQQINFQFNWVNGKYSNFKYLSLINILANRSYDDLSSYPIFPRLIINYKKEKFELNENNIRNLNKPIFMIEQNEKSLDIFKQRFQINKFHQSENISNPLSVCTFLCYLPPFCNYYWALNNGWDKGERIFKSIPNNFSIYNVTTSEFSPEMYSFPEIFLNLNKFDVLDVNGMEFPKWSKDSFRFIELQRYVLESDEIRNNLNKWIDLIFGVNQKGVNSIEHFNVFNPLSYYEPNVNNDTDFLNQKHHWMIQCGQVPLQVFTNSHQPSNIIQKIEMNQYKIVLNQKAGKVMKIQFKPLLYQSAILLESTQNNNQAKVSSPYFMFIKHYKFSENYSFLVLTTSISDVLVLSIFRNDNSTFSVKLKSKASFEFPKFSILYERHLLCLTACVDKVIIWSYANEMKISTIEIPNVGDMVIDNDNDALFMFSNKTLYQYTLSGFFVRKILVDSKITSIGLTGCGYSVFDKVIVVGCEDGTVKLIKISVEKGEFEIAKNREISPLAIIKIDANDRNNIINVYDFNYDQLKSCQINKT